MKTALFKLAVKILACAALIPIQFTTWAQPVIFSDNFDVDSSANWNINGVDYGGPSDFNVFFAFDYSTNKFVRNGVTNTIPAAPNGGGRGVKMYVNKNDAIAAIAAVGIFPKGQVFSNDYAFKVDMWLNYNGGFQGGTGSTEFGVFGINHTGTNVIFSDLPTTVVTNVSDGVWFGITGEGGAAQDYRAYVGDNTNTATRFQAAAAGFLDRDADSVIEEEVFNEDVNAYPLKQMFPAPQFETPGAVGKQWVEVEIRQRTNSAGEFIVTWLLNHYVIAEHTNGTPWGVTNGTVMIGNTDPFSSIAVPSVDNFVIYDNVKVVDLSGVGPLPIVSVTATDNEAIESPASETGVFTISRTGSTAGPLTVSFRTMGTASNGVDYTTSMTNTVTIAAGESSSNITIIPVNDTRGESVESVYLVLNGSPNYDIYNNVSALVNLLDDNDLPVASVSVFRPGAYEFNANRYGEFRIGFSNPYFNDATVNYVISGTAANGTDYELLSSSVLMTAGQTNISIYVQPINNASTVSNLTVILTLATGTGYTNSSTATNGTVTIFNDDLPAATGTLFSDNFDLDTSANWNTNRSLTNCDAIFAYDYSALGIPPAPHTVGGTTLGLKMRANTPVLGTPGAFSGISVSPKNQNFTGDYRLRFDLWLNFPGPFPAGGAGSTQLGTAGVTRGTIAQWPGGAATPDSTFFAVSGDGGTDPDIRVYTNALVNVNTGVYAAGTGTANNLNAYYAVFGNQAAPPDQLNNYPSQSGVISPGAFGMVWHDVVITKQGNTLTWTIDGLRMSTINAYRFGITLSTNIFVGHSDINAGQTTVALDALHFGLVDNLVVESLPAPIIPVITNIAIVNVTNVQVTFTAATSDFPALFLLLSSPSVGGGYANDNATVTQLSPGAFRAVTPYTTNSARFYRILR